MIKISIQSPRGLMKFVIIQRSIEIHKTYSLSVEFRRFLSDGSGNSRNINTYESKSAAKAQTTWPRSAPARLPCRGGTASLVAVSAWCGVVAHVPGNATRQRADSQSPPLGRNGSKRHFCGTYACSAATPCRAKYRVAISPARGARAPRYPSEA